MLYTYIREVICSNLSRTIPYSEVSHCVSQSLNYNTLRVPQTPSPLMFLPTYT
jgi:hypothetical protein